MSNLVHKLVTAVALISCKLFYLLHGLHCLTGLNIPSGWIDISAVSSYIVPQISLNLGAVSGRGSGTVIW